MQPVTIEAAGVGENIAVQLVNIETVMWAGEERWRWTFVAEGRSEPFHDFTTKRIGDPKQSKARQWFEALNGAPFAVGMSLVPGAFIGRWMVAEQIGRNERGYLRIRGAVRPVGNPMTVEQRDSITALARQAGLDRSALGDLRLQETGRASSLEMTADDAERLIGVLRGQAVLA
jgi:hypothetical protein